MNKFYNLFEQEIIRSLISLFDKRKENDWNIGVSTASGFLKSFFNSREIEVYIENSNINFIYKTPEDIEAQKKLYHHHTRLIMDSFYFLHHLKENRLIYFIEMDNDRFNEELIFMEGIENKKLYDGGEIIEYLQPQPFELSVFPGITFTQKYGKNITPTQRWSISIDSLKNDFNLNIYTTIFPTKSLIELERCKFFTAEELRYKKN